MELLNKIKVRLDDPKMSLSLYVFFEYTIYNCVSFKYRLKYLQIGANIFTEYGRSYYEFQDFHRSKANIFSYAVKIIYGVFGLFAILSYLINARFLVVATLMLIAYYLNRFVITDKTSRSSILNVDRFLFSPNWMENLERLLQIPLTDIDKFESLANQFYWGGLNMESSDNAELIVNCQEFSCKPPDEEIKNYSHKNRGENINSNLKVDLDQPITLKHICLNEDLSNKAIQILSDFFTEDGLVIKRNVSKSLLVAILYVLQDQKYLCEENLVAQDFQKIASNLLGEEVSMDTAKYTNRITKPKYDLVRKMFPKI